MKIKLNIAMNGYAKGKTITIKDENGIPFDRFWRARLNDAKIDSCIEIIQTKPISKQKPKKEVSSNDNA